MSVHEVEKPSGPSPPPADMVPMHRHRWQAVGVVQGSSNPVRERVLGHAPYYVAQSCECGEVRAVLLITGEE